MKNTTYLLVGIVGLVGMCCLGGAILSILGGAGSDVSGGGDPALFGQWQQGSGSLVTYRDALTGAFAPPSGSGTVYEFNPAGDCVYSAMLQVTTYGCTSWIFVYTDDCRWSERDGAMTVELREGTMRSKACGNDEVKEGPSKARTQRFRAAVSRDSVGRLLTLTDETGAQTLLHAVE